MHERRSGGQVKLKNFKRDVACEQDGLRQKATLRGLKPRCPPRIQIEKISVETTLQILFDIFDWIFAPKLKGFLSCG